MLSLKTATLFFNRVSMNTNFYVFILRLRYSTQIIYKLSEYHEEINVKSLKDYLRKYLKNI